EAKRDLRDVPGLLLRAGMSQASFLPTCEPGETFNLDDVPLPARGSLDRCRSRYACLLFRPVWLIETARGCPFRCSFCSVWPMYDRAVRMRSIESVCDDFAA